MVVLFVGEKSFLHLLLAVFAGRTKTRFPNTLFAERIFAEGANEELKVCSAICARYVVATFTAAYANIVRPAFNTIITPENFASVTSATVVILDRGSITSVPHAVFAVRTLAAAAAKRAWCAVFAPCAITAVAPIKQIASPRCRVGVAGFANRFAASRTVLHQ